MSGFEEVTREKAGYAEDGTVVFDTILTGRMRRPRSLDEWRAQQLAALAGMRAFPAARVVAGLLEAGETADVKAAGKPLTDWQRRGVLVELRRLAAAARGSFPAAAGLPGGLASAWARQWGDRELIPPRGDVAGVPKGRSRVLSMAEDPPVAEQVGADWAAFGAAMAASRVAGRNS